MKKVFLIALVLCLVLAVAACSNPAPAEQTAAAATATAGDTADQGGGTVTDNGAAATQNGNANNNLSVPADFPNNVPLYQGNATLIGSIRQEANDITIFHLVYGVNEATSEIGPAIGNTLQAQSAGGSFQQIMSGTEYMFMGTIGDWDYVVVVSDGSSDGFTSQITYQISEHQQ